MENTKNPLKAVATFFGLTFLMTWLFYCAITLFRLNAKSGLGMAFLIGGGMAPSLVGVVMALATYSKEGRLEYFRRFYQVKRIGAKWWLFILLIFPAISAVAVLVTLFAGGTMPAMEGLLDLAQNPVSIFPILLLGFFINGAWPEEWGWRGFALQPLLDRFGFLKANLLLGTLWAVWHLPLFFMPAMGHYNMGFIGFWFFVAQSIGMSIIMALVFIRTRQSTLSAMLLHMFGNLIPNLMAGYSQTYERIENTLVFVVGMAIGIYVQVARPQGAAQK